MEAFVIYFIKVNVAIIVLYLFYRGIFYKDTFFGQKRIALLFGTAFSLLYPYLDITNLIQYDSKIMMVTTSIGHLLPTVVVTPEQSSTTQWGLLLLWLYLGISTIFVLKIIVQFVYIAHLVIRSPKQKIEGLNIVHVQQGTSPFSFLKWVFINTNDFCAKDMEEILQHEKVHIDESHTLDVLLFELFCAIFWINPFAWLLKRLVRQNLEFIADKKVLLSGIDTKSYQYHLLRLTSKHPITRIGNYFNITELKHRIIMMNKKKTSLIGLGKHFLSLPLFAFLMIAFYSWGSKTISTELLSNAQKTNTINTKLMVNVHNENASYIQKKQTKVEPLTQIDIRTGKEDNYTVENMPIFPGGEIALKEFIASNLKYPIEAMKNGIEGQVRVKFQVSSTGTIEDVSVIKTLDKDCDDEAMRVVKQMPKWTPGSTNGKAIPVYYVLPIAFKLMPSTNQESKPLLLIDGKVTTYSDVNNLPIKQEDTQSITIIKDAAAKSIYGDAGKNGVIVVISK